MKIDKLKVNGFGKLNKREFTFEKNIYKIVKITVENTKKNRTLPSDYLKCTL